MNHEFNFKGKSTEIRGYEPGTSAPVEPGRTQASLNAEQFAPSVLGLCLLVQLPVAVRDGKKSVLGAFCAAGMIQIGPMIRISPNWRKPGAEKLMDGHRQTPSANMRMKKI